MDTDGQGGVYPDTSLLPINSMFFTRCIEHGHALGWQGNSLMMLFVIKSLTCLQTGSRIKLRKQEIS